MNTVPVFSWSSAALTDVGKVRQINEDSFLDLPQTGLWIVADGMGGHSRGDLASRTIVETLRPMQYPKRLSQFAHIVQRALIEVNHSLVEIANDQSIPTTIGSTVVALLMAEGQCACVWAGDSRIYRYRNGILQQLTVDHSEVEMLVQQGQLTPEQAASHPLANVLTRAVGAHDHLILDTKVEGLRHGDRYLLCSDGLNKEVSDEEISQVLRFGNSKDACRTLVEMTLARGSRDNVTVVVVDVDRGKPRTLFDRIRTLS